MCFSKRVKSNDKKVINRKFSLIVQMSKEKCKIRAMPIVFGDVSTSKGKGDS